MSDFVRNMDYFLKTQEWRDAEVIWEDLEDLEEKLYFREMERFFDTQERILQSSFTEIFPGIVAQEYRDDCNIPVRIFWRKVWLDPAGVGVIVLDEGTNEVFSAVISFEDEEKYPNEIIIARGYGTAYQEISWDALSLLKEVLNRFISKEVGFSDLKKLGSELLRW